MPTETIDHNFKKEIEGHFFNFHTQMSLCSTVFNLVIILRSTHIYQVYKSFCWNNKSFKVGSQMKEREGSLEVEAFLFFRVKSRFEDVYVPFDKLLQSNQLGGCRLPHSLPDLSW